MATDHNTRTQRNSLLNQTQHPIQINLHQISDKFERNDTGEVNESTFSGKHYKVAGESDDVYEIQIQNQHLDDIEKQERMLNEERTSRSSRESCRIKIEL